MTCDGQTSKICGTAAAAAALLLGAAFHAIPAQQPAASPPADLLSAPPFDRVTLIDGTIMTVEPVSPRPLPAYDPSKDPGRKKTSAEKEAAKKENVKVDEASGKLVLVDPEKPAPAGDGVNVLNLKPIGDANVYQVRRASIKSIEYFEDLLLAEGDRLVQARDFARAFEHFLAVQNRVADWNGLPAHVDRLLFAEASAAISDRDVERGLRLLRELKERSPGFQGLNDALAQAYGGRIARAVEAGAFPEGRRELHELEGLVGGHPVVNAMRRKFADLAGSHRDEAVKTSDPATRLDRLTEALRVWPTLDGLDAAFQEAFRAYPTLDVAVADVPAEPGPWNRSSGEDRVASLLYRPILQADDEAAFRGQLPAQLADSVELADLGRRLEINLRDGPAWSDGSGPVTSIDLVRSFTEAIYPGSPRYRARWDDLLDRVEAPTPRRVTIWFRRSPLKPGAWLLDPVGPAHAGRDGRIPGPDGARIPVGDGPFLLSPIDPKDGRLTLLSRGDSQGASLRRIRERPIAEGHASLEALLEGEVSLLAHVPTASAPGLAKAPEIRVGRYTDPRLHVIAIDGRNPVLRNRTLRRALSYAIDRKALLAAVAGANAADEAAGVLDGIAPRGSYAEAPGLPVLELNPMLARMLAAAGRKELDTGPIKLLLDYPALPEVRSAVPILVEAWKQAGVEVSPRESPLDDLERRLRSGEPFELAYRVVTCREPIVDLGPALCPGYDAPRETDPLGSVASPRILQLLLQLEQAPEFPTARGLAIEVDRATRDELPVLPLWQVPAFYAWRTRLSGPGETADTLYRGVESWTIEPWYARDPW